MSVCQMRDSCQMYEHEHWQGDECAAKCVDAVEYLVVSKEMKPAVLAASLMAHT